MKNYIKFLLFVICIGVFTNAAEAQKKRTAKHRQTVKNTKSKTKTNITQTAAVDSVATAKPVAAAPPPVNDSLPIKKVLPSLRPDEAVVDANNILDVIPLDYKSIRIDDAV